ncbi:MAG TPA: aminotransferase class I/II-fold pyridoxal phosphate-dependent enzyme [Patescibacteria group bacterium]|nr:aminotransferase class I/II-fold pyridoxal phosphate-dependent enzyme [Patescibacteria group bacterium]
MIKDLTQLEIPRLPEIFNLTDGHAHRPLSEAERGITDKLSELFSSVDREQQPVLEDAYVTAFYALTHQTVDKDKTQYLFLPSASISLEIIANYVRLNKMSLALTEPCFDNLANIFMRHDIPLESISDVYLEMDGWGGRLESIRSDVICIVSPNNPTGIAYTQANFEQLVAYCKKENKLLILDTSFRAYRPADSIFDEYKYLQESGIDYMVVEDTGKTWPTKELKTSILAVSPSLYKQVFNIYTDFIYHHSPFVIKLLTKLIDNSAADGLQSVHSIVETNRKALSEAVEGTILESLQKKYTSVAWLAVKSEMTATEVAAKLAEDDIFVLPGNHFFWSDKSLGNKFIRVALVRDPALFGAAAKRLRSTLLVI